MSPYSTSPSVFIHTQRYHLSASILNVTISVPPYTTLPSQCLHTQCYHLSASILNVYQSSVSRQASNTFLSTMPKKQNYPLHNTYPQKTTYSSWSCGRKTRRKYPLPYIKEKKRRWGQSALRVASLSFEGNISCEGKWKVKTAFNFPSISVSCPRFLVFFSRRLQRPGYPLTLSQLPFPSLTSLVFLFCVCVCWYMSVTSSRLCVRYVHV
jgi:hypothetical protein